MSLYLDKDSRGVYSLHEISIEELNALRALLSTYRNPRYPELETTAFEAFSCIDQQLLILEANGRPQSIPHGEP